jgi:hypothetical protein
MVPDLCRQSGEAVKELRGVPVSEGVLKVVVSPIDRRDWVDHPRRSGLGHRNPCDFGDFSNTLLEQTRSGPITPNRDPQF